MSHRRSAAPRARLWRASGDIYIWHALSERVACDQLIAWVNWVMRIVYFAKSGECRVHAVFELDSDMPANMELLELKDRSNGCLVKIT